MRVTVVAGNPVMRAGLDSILRAQGFETDAVSEPAAVARLFGGDAPDAALPDAVLIDAVAADADAVGKLLDALPTHTAVVLLDTRGEAAWALHDGGRALLPPTATAEEIVTALRAAAAGLIVVHPALAAPRHAAPSPADASVLTARELEILGLLAEGIGNKSIARRLDISEHTVKFHLSSILAKLGARSRTEAVMLAARLGLVML
ncbi:response regulator transcription factor [Azospirillum sp. TSO22-1]|uniref:helix-turn-helix transcriptional regulator n=1 Tax=Azospirillum sp. TSO22-1 TaxID=716789 RepID=UPI000D609AEA|nr:response regulator transcription factor [Azospirillum sp. TSO22-1]PWC31936.1 hypothetical protein TSO221_32210 [Azospirillum sp. TSO22-1]